MKKLTKLFLIALLCVGFFGCTAKEKDLTLDEMMEEVYADIKEDELPMMIELFPIDEENEQWFLGTDKIEYKEALASESGIGSVPHSVVLIRANSEKEAEEVKATLKKTVNSYKWVCVGVEPSEVVIESKEDIVLLVLDGFNLSSRLKDNFLEIF